MANAPSLSSPITLVGAETTAINADTLGALPTRTRTVEIDCQSGDRYTASWQGAAIPDLLEQTPVRPSTTHLVVEGRDGYRVCVGIERALEGLLAIARDDTPLPEAVGYETRFVAPDLEGPRAVVDVARIETATLAPGDDPEFYEELWPDD